MTDPDPLADFHVVIDQPVAWGDMDSFGHVNNVVYFRYFENARVEYFRRIGWWEYMDRDRHRPDRGVDPGPVPPAGRSTRTRCGPGPRWCRSAPTGSRSGTCSVSRATGELVTEGDAVVVCIDYRANAKVPMPEELRKRIEELEASGVA